MKKCFIILVGFSFLFSCSNEHDLNESPKAEIITAHAPTIEDGRLSFSTKEDFEKFYSSIKEKSDENVASLFEERYYSQDFLSLYPISENKDFIYKHLNKINTDRHILSVKHRLSSSNKQLTFDEEEVEEFEDIFGDERLSTLINSEGELEVDNKIYKFTDAGLFIFDEEKKDDVNSLLLKNNISPSLYTSSDRINSEKFITSNNPKGGLVSLIPGVEHFVSPSSSFLKTLTEDLNHGGSSSSYTSTQKMNGDYFQIASTLKKSTGKKPFVGNLFGTVIVSYDKYDSKHRVKVKYYDIDILLGYAIGLKTKHSKKGWTGLWRNQHKPKIVQGINSITWKFDKEITLRFAQNQRDIFFRNNNAYFRDDVYMGNRPFPKTPLGKKVDILVTEIVNSGLIDSEEKAHKYIQQVVFESIKSGFKKLDSYFDNKPNNVLVTLIPNGNSKEELIRISYFNYSACSNCAVIDNTFDFGFVTPTYNLPLDDGFSSGSLDWGGNYDFRHPKVVELNGFGMANVGSNEWHGIQVSFKN